MEVIVKKKEVLEKYPNQYFIYFDFLKEEKKTIVTPKTLSFLKIDSINVGDKINVSRGFKSYKEFFLVRGVLKNA